MERESLIECNYCYNKTFYFDKVISCIEYDDISKKLILDFKYKSKRFRGRNQISYSEGEIDSYQKNFRKESFTGRVPFRRRRTAYFKLCCISGILRQNRKIFRCIFYKKICMYRRNKSSLWSYFGKKPGWDRGRRKIRYSSGAGDQCRRL